VATVKRRLLNHVVLPYQSVKIGAVFCVNEFKIILKPSVYQYCRMIVKKYLFGAKMVQNTKRKTQTSYFQTFASYLL